MRRSILFTVLALGAQAAWAQEATDPALPDDGEAVVERTETVTEETVVSDSETDTTEETSVSETEVTDETVDETATAETTEETEDQVTEETEATDVEVADGEADEADDPAPEVVEDVTDVLPLGERHDNRSATGAFRGGHHGTVSTMARAGLGPVFGKLRSQGYGDIQIEQVGDEILVSAARGGEVRHLVYDAASGSLLSDSARPQGSSLVRAITNRLRQDPADRKQSRNATRSRDGTRTAAGKGSDGRGNGGNGGGKSGHGSHGGGSNGGGNGSHGAGNGSHGGGNGNGGGKNR